MVIFDQRNQNVTYQYNVQGTINFGNAQNQADVVAQLKILKNEVLKALDSGTLDEEISIDVEANIRKAVIQAEKPNPDGTTIVKYLQKGREILSDFVALSGLAGGFLEAIKVVRSFF